MILYRVARLRTRPLTSTEWELLMPAALFLVFGIAVTVTGLHQQAENLTIGQQLGFTPSESLTNSTSPFKLAVSFLLFGLTAMGVSVLAWSLTRPVVAALLTLSLYVLFGSIIWQGSLPELRHLTRVYPNGQTGLELACTLNTPGAAAQLLSERDRSDLGTLRDHQSLPCAGPQR